MLPGVSGHTGVSNAPSRGPGLVLAHHPSRGAPHLQRQPDPPGPRSPMTSQLLELWGCAHGHPLPAARSAEALGLTGPLSARRQPRPQVFLHPSSVHVLRLPVSVPPRPPHAVSAPRRLWFSPPFNQTRTHLVQTQGRHKGSPRKLVWGGSPMPTPESKSAGVQWQ